jgi:hypothetical protein
VDTTASIRLSALTRTKLQLAAYDLDTTLEDLAADILAAWQRPRSTAPVNERVRQHRERRRRARYGADYRERYCEGCGGQMPRDVNPNARYCTDRCRQRAYRERVAAR